MNRPEAIAFCKKRIIEQNEYVNTTASRKDITYPRKRELLVSAILVRYRFKVGLIHLIGLCGYACFKLYEEPIKNG